MTIRERVDLYKDLFKNCGAIAPVRELMERRLWLTGDDFEKLEAVRELNTKLSEVYQVNIPVITVWVRDNNYVTATEEIYLTEPDLEAFLHQYRHHLQNIERRYERRGLTVEGNMKIADIPYGNTLYRMYGEDDAIAWAQFIIEVARD